MRSKRGRIGCSKAGVTSMKVLFILSTFPKLGPAVVAAAGRIWPRPCKVGKYNANPLNRLSERGKDRPAVKYACTGSIPPNLWGS